MSKRIFLIAGGALCLLGLIIVLIGVAVAGGKSEGNLQNSDDITAATAKALGYTEAVQDFTGDYRQIEISCENQAVRVLVGEADAVRITYYEWPGAEYSWENEDGVLRFLQVGRNNFSADMSWLISFGTRYVTVELPRSYAGDLIAATTNSAVKLKNAELGSVALQSTNGSVEAENCTAFALDIQTKNAAVKLSGVEVSRELTVETSNAKIDLEQVTAERTECTTSNGRVLMEDSSFTGPLTITDSNGAVGLERLTCADITVHTTNAAIRANILGDRADYSIVTHTTNGSCNFGDQTGSGGSLHLETTNGSIHIGFSEGNDVTVGNSAGGGWTEGGKDDDTSGDDFNDWADDLGDRIDDWADSLGDSIEDWADSLGDDVQVASID